MTMFDTLLIWMRVEFQHQCHSDLTSGHLGTKKTLSRVRERFMWQGMVNDVNKLVKK